MKRCWKKLFVLLVVFCLLIQCNIAPAYAAGGSSVGKPSISTVKQTGKNKVKVSWGKVSGAKGYSLEYRKSGGSWKKKDTGKKSVSLSGMEQGTTYQFRVRAYKKVNGAKKYGKYSVTKKLKVNDYVYLVNLYQPYSKSYYEAYPNGQYFVMGGKKQKNGFVLRWEGGRADYNIEGKYSEISFTMGRVDDSYYLDRNFNDTTYGIEIYADGVLVDTLVANINGLPRKYTLSLDYAEQLTIKDDGKRALAEVGFSDVKLYY